MSSDSNINQVIKTGPKLTSSKEYSVWKKAMKNYLAERKLDDVLIMQIPDWKGITDKVDAFNAKSNKVAYDMMGIKLKDATSQPKIKDEEEKFNVDINSISEDIRKTIINTVQRVKTVYNILYEALPSDIRNCISVEIQGNGAALWTWLEERLHGNTIDVTYETISELFTIKQSSDETFETYKARVDELNEKLAATKEDLSPTLYRYVLLTKLRSEYQHFVVSLNLSKEYKEGTQVEIWKNISLAIQNFERTNLSNKSDSSSSSETAMAAHYKSNIKGSNNYHKSEFNPQCHHCGEFGHIRPKCPKLNKKVSYATPKQANMASSSSNSIEDAPEGQQSYSGNTGFSVTACIPRKLYSEVACAGMSITARRIPATSSTDIVGKNTTPTTSNITPLKRLIRPGESTKLKTGVTPKPSMVLSSSGVGSSKVVVQNRFDALRDAKVPGPSSSKSGKPIEMRLKFMTWGVDTMASVHCTGNKDVFATRRRCTPIRIKCANHEHVIADQVGTVKLRVRTEGGNVITLPIQDVYYSKDLGPNLLSGIKLAEDLKLKVSITGTKSTLVSDKGTHIPLNMKGRLLTIDGDAPAIVYHAAAVKGLVIETPEELMTTHVRLGHIGYDKLIKLINSDKAHGIGKLNMSQNALTEAHKLIQHCTACIEAKATNTPHSGGVMNRGTTIGEVLHFDTFEVRIPGKAVEYGVAIVEPFSGLIMCSRAKTKDLIANEVINVFKFIENKTRNKVKYCYTDGGTEFINTTLKSYCRSNGITLHYSPPRTPKWNGTAERTVRTIKDGARCLLKQASLPDTYWYHAINHYLYIRNRTFISEHTDKTPYESYYGSLPSVRTVSVFGCDVYVWLDKKVRESGTFASRGVPGIYLGHCRIQNCPIVMLLGSNKIVRNRAVDFREDQFNYSRAIKKGGDSVQDVIDQSQSGGVLSWYEPSESQIVTDSTIISSSNTVSDCHQSNINVPNVIEDDESDSDLEDGFYRVESILGHLKCNVKSSSDGYKYRIKWEGYDESESTWEPVSSLEGTADKILKSYRVSVGLESDPDTVISVNDSDKESSGVGSH